MNGIINFSRIDPVFTSPHQERALQSTTNKEYRISSYFIAFQKRSYDSQAISSPDLRRLGLHGLRVGVLRAERHEAAEAGRVAVDAEALGREPAPEARHELHLPKS